MSWTLGFILGQNNCRVGMNSSMSLLNLDFNLWVMKIIQ